jgi:trigger factor
MNSTVEKISLTQRKIRITVGKDEIAPFKQRALQKIGAKAKIKGFRPGKVPAAMLEKFHGSEIAYETLNFLISDSKNLHQLVHLAHQRLFFQSPGSLGLCSSL